MGKKFLAQELNAPITKNHGLSNRPAQPVATKLTKHGDK